jgi:hypothetical protein
MEARIRTHYLTPAPDAGQTSSRGIYCDENVRRGFGSVIVRH